MAGKLIKALQASAVFQIHRVLGLEQGRILVREDATENPFMTFHEWDEKADRRAYADL